MAFTFFKTKKPIETRRQQRDALAARLSSARADVEAAREACTIAAVEGAADAELAKVEFAKRQAEDRVASLSSALQAFDAEIATQASAEAAALDRKTREATARDLCACADRIEKNLAPFLAAVKVCKADVEAALLVVSDIGGLHNLYHRLIDEMPAAHSLIASEVRARAAMTIDGRAPAALPMPEVVIPPIPPIPRTQIFALQNLRWTDPETRQQALCERFNFAHLPVGLASKAIDLGIAIAPDNPRVQEVKHFRRGAPPIPETCYDLDTGQSPQPPSGPLPFDPFRRIDRGPPTRMSLAPPAILEPMAARGLPIQTNEPDND